MWKGKLESEKDVEKYLCDRVEETFKGIAYKFSSPNRRNVPDRLCILPHGVHFFVELKSEGKNPSRAQLREMVRLNDMEHPVWVARTRREVDEIIKTVSDTISGDPEPSLIIVP